MFLNPMLLDLLSVCSALRIRDSSFGHPVLFSKSNNYFPEMELLSKFRFLSSGCFLLSILLNTDSEMFVSFIITEFTQD